MKKSLLYSEGDYAIWRHEGIPDEALAFLDRIAWGNDGAVYEHKNTEEHIRLLHQPTLIAIHETDKIQGTAVFCNTPVTVGALSLNCYYIRYFASSREIRGKGVMKKYGIKVMETIRDDEKAKTVFFACIEKGNKASYKTVESAGYENIGIIKTNGFSRYFPRRSKNIEQVNTDLVREEVLALLKQQYAAYSLVQFNSIFLQDQYYVIRENGEIVAGCQSHRVHWVINKMPGFMGKIIMRVVPLIPVLNQLFNPKRFEFLAFEGIYVKPGFENRLMELFEGLLAREQLKSSMYWLGESCPLRKRIQEKGKTGLIHSFIKDSDVFIMAAFHDLTTAEIADFKSRPLFVSGFDYI
ncbi:MAG: GNAT family N-acetyltransferase [Lewinellaceae bacterium]|nr:GNAT family N-acetyltransferase [Lewinellaceae bacterium]